MKFAGSTDGSGHRVLAVVLQSSPRIEFYRVLPGSTELSDIEFVGSTES